MQSLNLTTTVGEFDVRAELAFGERWAHIFTTLSGAVRIQRTIDLGPLLAAGLSRQDALDFTLRAVCVGIESGALRDF